MLYLLHGRSDDETAWLRWSAIERHVSELRLAVVMPNAGRSFYTDQAVGYDYFTFISEELPSRDAGFFPLSSERADTFVAGLSMGGYGALKWALGKPDAVAAAASLSGAVDIVGRERDAEWLANHGSVERARAVDDDLFALIDGLTAEASPALYVSCGTDDGLLAENRRFRDRAEKSRPPPHLRRAPRRPRVATLGRGDPAGARLAAAARLTVTVDNPLGNAMSPQTRYHDTYCPTPVYAASTSRWAPPHSGVERVSRIRMPGGTRATRFRS